jgi:IS5 family transposase
LTARLGVLTHRTPAVDTSNALVRRGALCAPIEHPNYQLFCGEEFFRHKPPFDRSSLMLRRQRMGEEKLVALIQESLNAATRTGAAKPSDVSKVIVDTTVQPQVVAFPGAPAAGAARQEAQRDAARVLCARRQARLDRLAALRPRQAVQARQPGAVIPEIETQIGANLSRIVATAATAATTPGPTTK